MVRPERSVSQIFQEPAYPFLVSWIFLFVAAGSLLYRAVQGNQGSKELRRLAWFAIFLAVVRLPYGFIALNLLEEAPTFLQLLSMDLPMALLLLAIYRSIGRGIRR